MKLTQFDRTAQVTIGAPGEVGLRVSGLRISFSVVKDDTKESNESTIEIFNLSKSSRRKIDKIDELVFLEAGYEDGSDLETLFIGNITRINHSITPPDIITKIIANDGSKEKKDKKASLSFSSGISGREVLRKVLQTFSIGSNFRDVSFEDKSYANGFSFIGSSVDALTKVTRFLSLDWSIQNNEIKFVLFDGDDGSGTVIISPETGMIGSPEKESFADRNAKGESIKKDIPGWRITSLLQPKVIPTGRIILDSKQLEEKHSVFTVMNISHSGDTHGSDWTSVLEVKE